MIMTLPIFKALADETRLRLVNILLHYELSVNELVRILGMGQSRVSRHLKILSESGLLRSRRDGLWVFYSVPPKGDKRDFLVNVMPFFAKDKTLANDLDVAAQILEERARRARQFFNSIAENWDDLNREILGDFDLPGVVDAAMPRPCPVAVDLGCGTGAVLEKIRSGTGLAIGVDGSARMLELCRERMPAGVMANGAVSLRIGELSHLPLADHEASFACINLVLHHLAKIDEVFTEIRRVLMPGGTLFIADFSSHSDETMRVRYGDHRLGFEEGDLRADLERSGFTIIKTERRPVNRGLELMLFTCAVKI